MIPLNVAIIVTMNDAAADAASDVYADSSGGVDVPWCWDRMIALMLCVSLRNQHAAGAVISSCHIAASSFRAIGELCNIIIKR